MNSLEKWAVDQLLGANADQNIPAAIEKKIIAQPGLSLDQVKSDVNADVAEAIDAAAPNANVVAVAVAEGLIDGLVDGWVTSVYAKVSAPASPAPSTESVSDAPAAGDAAPGTFASV